MGEEVGERLKLGPRQWARILRWATLAIAALAAVYLGVRFDFVTLPDEGCSPVTRYSPGVGLLVDRWASGWVVGDAVFVSDDAGAVHLVLLEGENEEGAWWTGTDAEDCPGVSPADLGWLSEEELLGRVVLSMGR